MGLQLATAFPLSDQASVLLMRLRPSSLPPPFANMASAFPVPTARQLPSAPPPPLPVPPRLPRLLLTLATTASAFPLPAACSDSSSRSRCSAASGTDARSRKEGRMPAACMAMPEASSVTCVRACGPQHPGWIRGGEELGKRQCRIVFPLRQPSVFGWGSARGKASGFR